MIEGLRPYPISAMKSMARTNSINVSWLNSIPEHWRIVRSKGLFAARAERARPEDEQLSATQAFGVIPQAEFERRVGRKVVRITQHLDKRAHVEPDDFVISMRSFQGGLERAWARGCIRSSYVVLKPSAEARVGYFAHLFKCQDYIRALQATSNFIRDGQDLNMNNFVLVDLPLPPADEQDAIARFLDHANRKIDGFIRAKRKLIALLGEQKQAIIHRAVTRGLNPNAPLKPSGIPWLGDIPQHWSLKRFKFLATITSGQVDPRKAEYRDLALIAPNHIQSGSGRLLKQETAAEQGADSGKYLVTRGQVIYSKIRPNLRKATIAPCDCLCSADMYPITPKSGELSHAYLLLLLLSQPFTKFAVDTSMRVAMPKVNREALANCLMWYPQPEEQIRILEFVAHEGAPFETTIARLEREIELLREYRTRLTADVVTGKLDVRPAVAHLSEPITDSVPEPSMDELQDETEAGETVA